MAKRKVKDKRGLPYNRFDGEGESMNMLQKSGAVANNAFGSSNLGGTIGSIGSGITSIAQAGMNNAQIADTSSIQDQIKAQNNMVVGASDNDSLLSEWSSLSMLKDNYSWKDVRGGSNANRAMNTIGGAVQGAATGATVGGPIGAIAGAVIGLGSAIGGWITGNRKAKRAARRLNQQASAANQRALTSFENRASDIDTQNDLTMASNYFDYGGPIFSTGAIGYDLASRDLNNKQMKALGDMRLTSLPNSFNVMPDVSTINTFKDGGIFIKPENRGKFTALKERTGKSSTWYKEHGTPAQKKMATFALNAAKWKHADGGPLNPYSAGALVDAIYSSFNGEKFLGKPSHNYDFTISEEEANKLGYYPDERGHRDDRVKKPTHPTHPSRGKWNSFEEFELTDKGMENPNYTLFGLVDGGQDPQAVMTYKGGVVLPEITVTPKESYIMNPYDNIKIFDKGGSLTNKKSSSRRLDNNYKEGEIYDVTEEEVKLLKELGYEFEYV